MNLYNSLSQFVIVILISIHANIALSMAERRNEREAGERQRQTLAWLLRFLMLKIRISNFEFRLGGSAA